MNLLPRASELQSEEKIRRLVYVRLVVATLVVGAAIMALQIQSARLSAAALYGLLGLLYLGTGAVYLAYRSGVSFFPLVRLLITLDLVVLTLLLHYSGGSGSIFAILFILPIFVGGIYFQVSGGIVTSVIAASAYIIYALLEMSGRVGGVPDVSQLTRQGMFDSLLKAYLYLGVFLCAGLLSGYFSRRVLHSGKELADREKEIRRIQLSTDSILKNMSSGLVVVNLEGELVSINPAAKRILDLKVVESSPEGNRFEEMLTGGGALIEKLDQVVKTGRQVNRDEITVLRRGGLELPLGITISLLRDEDGNKKGVIALFQDLTKVRRMRERMRKSDRMAAVGELSAAIAHEIRAPLASICGSVEMLKEDLELSGENKELMDLVIRESDRLDGIITEFLDYARMRKPEFDSVNIEQCVRETALLLKRGSHLKEGGRLSVERAGGKTLAMADEEQIRQVFLNLGLNACDVIGRKGELIIRINEVLACPAGCADETECVMVDFVNNGPPIHTEVLPHIFEPFFTTKEGGTGLGLATAARIIESHAGTISVEKSDKKETIFRVLLPLRRIGETIAGGQAEEKLTIV